MNGCAILPPGMHAPGTQVMSLTVRPLEVEIGDVLPGFTRPVTRIIQRHGTVHYFDATGTCLTRRRISDDVRVVRRAVAR